MDLLQLLEKKYFYSVTSSERFTWKLLKSATLPVLFAFEQLLMVYVDRIFSFISPARENGVDSILNIFFFVCSRSNLISMLNCPPIKTAYILRRS